MQPNPWLAIDAATPPMLAAREVRHAWELFMGKGELEAVREKIVGVAARVFATE